MKRRRWMELAGHAAIASLLPACAAGGGKRVSLSAAQRLGGRTYGIWKGDFYIGGRDLEERYASLSITKAFAALAVTHAIGEGWLELDKPLVDVIPEWGAHPAKRLITLRMLLNQTAGFPSGVAQLYRGRIADKGQVAISLPLVDPPGSIFRYGPASSEIIGELLRRRLRQRGSSTEQLFREVMSRVGISSPDWRKDAGGRYYLSTGAEFSVRDLGQLGRVVSSLARGENIVGLKSSVFRDMTSPQPANPMFSAGFWWNRNAARVGAYSVLPERNIAEPRPPSFWRGASFAPDSDPDWLAMVGSGGKRVYVLPSQDLVIVRFDRNEAGNDGEFLRAISA